MFGPEFAWVSKTEGDYPGPTKSSALSNSPVQILKRVAEILLLFGDQGRIPESIHCSNQTPHHHISALDCPPESRLDCFAFGLEVSIIGRRDSCAMRFQEFAQSLKCRPCGSAAFSIGFEFVQEFLNRVRRPNPHQLTVVGVVIGSANPSIFRKKKNSLGEPPGASPPN